MTIVYFHKSRIVSLIVFLLCCGIIFSLAITRGERMRPALQRVTLFSIKSKSSVSADDAFAKVARSLSPPATDNVANKADSVETLAMEALNDQVRVSADDVALDVPETLAQMQEEQEALIVPKLTPQQLAQLLQNDEDPKALDGQPVSSVASEKKMSQTLTEAVPPAIEVPKVQHNGKQAEPGNEKAEAQVAEQKKSTQSSGLVAEAKSAEVAAKISPPVAVANSSVAADL